MGWIFPWHRYNQKQASAYFSKKSLAYCVRLDAFLPKRDSAKTSYGYLQVTGLRECQVDKARWEDTADRLTGLAEWYGWEFKERGWSFMLKPQPHRKVNNNPRGVRTPRKWDVFQSKSYPYQQVFVREVIHAPDGKYISFEEHVTGARGFMPETSFLRQYKLFRKTWEKARSNPRGEIDRHAAHELVLYAENDGDLYRQMRRPIELNLLKKFEQGKYDPKRATILWKNFADSAAKKYAREFASPSDWNQIFSPSTRHAAALEMQRHWEGEMPLEISSAKAAARKAMHNPHRSRRLS